MGAPVVMDFIGPFNKQLLSYRFHLKKKQKQKEREERKEEPKSIWIRASIRERAEGDLEYAWFNLNPEDPKLRGSSPHRKQLITRLPLPPTPPTLLHGAAFAISASRIYALGGVRESCKPQESRDVYILGLDGTGCSSRWIPGPPMLCPRAKPACIIVDGKLYVFGGLCVEVDPNLPFGEVYDPTTDIWDALPRFPIERAFGSFSTASRASITAVTAAGNNGKHYIPVHLSGSHCLIGYSLKEDKYSHYLMREDKYSIRNKFWLQYNQHSSPRPVEWFLWMM